MRLSGLVSTILETAEFKADISVEELARIVKSKSHVVYHALARMVERGLIQRRAYIDSYLLGTMPFIIFATIPPHCEDIRSKFLIYLKHNPAISFVAEVN